MDKRKIPGLQLTVVRDGKIIKAGNYGYANIQDSIPVNDRTVFTINSITKAFTGVAIMQLVEAGKVNLNAPISTYLSDIPAAWHPVTLLQLLSHTSGIPDIVDEEESLLIANGEEAAWKKVLVMPVEYKAGERFKYNQTNYLLLGMVINKVTGMSFQQFITDNQLKTVGMPKTIRSGFGATKDIVPHAAGGYALRKGKLSNMFFSLPPTLQTAAGMSSTASEIAEWIIALQSDKLLKHKASLDVLWTPAKLNNASTAGFGGLLNGYAVGWPTIMRPEHPAAAAVGGGRSAAIVYPKDNLSIIVLTNLSGASPETFIDELAGFYLPDMKEANGFGLSSSVRKLRSHVEKDGYKTLKEKIAGIKKNEADFMPEEKDMNIWAYRLLRQGRMHDALEIFKTNVDLYPTSANTHDSLGEIYAELGDKKSAIKSYERSLALNPANEGAERMLKQLKSLQ